MHKVWRARHIISLFLSTSMQVSWNFRGSFHGRKFTSTEAYIDFISWKHAWKSVKEDLPPWKFAWKLVEVDLRPWKLVKVSMEIHGSFHCRWKCKVPLLPSIAASTNIFRGRVLERPYTSTYFYQLSRVSSCFHKTSIRVDQLPCDLLPWKFPSSSMKGKSFYGSKLYGSRFASGQSVQVDFLRWKFMEVDSLP